MYTRLLRTAGAYMRVIAADLFLQQHLVPTPRSNTCAQLSCRFEATIRKRNKIKRRLRNIMNDAVKEISLKYHYSYLVIAKSTMLNNEFKIIKETLFQDFKKIK